MSVPAIQLVCLIVALWFYHGNTVSIKMVDAPHSNRYFSSSSSTTALSLRAPPANISGPPHLRLLSGECFKLVDKSYTYSVCPFQNVTQKEDSSIGWNNFHGVLGVWREWIIEDDRFVGMHYTLGEPCGIEDREAKVLFNCSTVTLLANVTEPNRCKYTIWLHTPLACFKGAMQIYHVMDQRLIDSWDEVNLDYNNGELTKKGLLKKQKEVLLDAGLYYNFTKDKEYFKKQQSTKNEFNSNLFTSSLTTAVNSELEECNKRVQSFEKQLQDAENMMQGVMTIIGDKYPLLKEKIQSYLTQHYQNNSAIKNGTLLGNVKRTNITHPTSAGTIVNGRSKLGEEERKERRVGQMSNVDTAMRLPSNDNNQLSNDYNPEPPLTAGQFNNYPGGDIDADQTQWLNNDNNNNHHPAAVQMNNNNDNLAEDQEAIGRWQNDIVAGTRPLMNNGMKLTTRDDDTDTDYDDDDDNNDLLLVEPK